VTAPAGVTAGDTFDLTVTAYDALGNVGQGYRSSVHFSSSDTLAGLPADYTFTPEDSGVHTFKVTLKTAGSDFVNATEIGRNVTGGTYVSVSPAAASSFQLAGASGAIGVARPVTIVARDVYGNKVTGYTGSVHVTSSDAAAVLPTDLAMVNGSATANVTLLTVGTQTITATDVADPTLTGTMSSDATPPVAARFAVSGYSATTTAGVSNNFTITVVNTIGQTATGFTGTIYFSSSDVQAGLPASYTFTAADAGVHSFAATLKTAGTQSIVARDASGALGGSQAGINVTAAAFAGYKLSVPLAADSKGHMLVTAGDVIALTVRAQDAYGNLVANYKGKVKFTSTDAQAALPSDYAFAAADAGVHTFNVALKTVTPNSTVWSFNAVDASLTTSLSSITNFEVTNAAAARFAINVPSNITAGTPFLLKLDVFDAYGNRVKNYFGTVHFANTAGIVGLPADYAFNSLDGGSHDFTVSLSTTGNQTLTITDLSDGTLKSSVGVSVKTASTGGGGGGGGSTGGGGGGGGGGKKTV
jgi:uncharacterized membrane protein YgcG